MWTTVKLASIHCIYVNELQKKEKMFQEDKTKKSNIFS